MIVLTWRNLWCLSAGKNQLHPSFLLDIAKILQTCYFRYLGKPGYTHPKWYNQLVEKLCLKTVCRQKTALSPSFSGDIVKIHKPILLGNLGMYGYANPKICMPKTNFIMHFFFEILHFTESYNLIGWQHSGPSLENQNFARYGIGGEISVLISVFILDYFQEK